MDTIRDFLINHIEEIIVGLIIAIIGGLILPIKKFVMFVWNKIKPEPPVPEEKSVYLNTPKTVLNDSCIGRDELLKEVHNAIINNKTVLYPNRHIAITGMDGIGKTLFCQTLFTHNLRYSDIYLGWIECNGSQSVFDIMKSSIYDLRFYRKSKQAIISNLNELDKPCVLFVDQVDQDTPMPELVELSICPNVILVVAGLLKKIDWIDDKHTFFLPALSDEYALNIFQKISEENIALMDYKNRKAVKNLLDFYAKGNPFLINAFAKAKDFYAGKWTDMLENMGRREYDEVNYLNNILRQLYKIIQLNEMDKLTLSKLSVIPYEKFTEAVFEFLDIPYYCVERLSRTYWLTHEDSIMYFMDEMHSNVITRLFPIKENLRNTLLSMNTYLSDVESLPDNGFKWISLYVENILKSIQGYAPNLMEEEVFAKFALKITKKYDLINNNKKALEWIELCEPEEPELAYDKAYWEYRVKEDFINSLFSGEEIEELYFNAVEKAKATRNSEDNISFLKQEYCVYLGKCKRHGDVVSLCKEYFESYPMDLSNRHNCIIFFRYLHAAYVINDEESLKTLVNDENISSLEQNEKITIAAAWSFGELGRIYKRWGNETLSDKYTKRMVILINEQKGFFHHYINMYLDLSEEQFSEYMHSCDELLDSLNEALRREDAEALYVEGRFQEKNKNYEEAFALYEQAASRDSLRGMCSLALLYYRGQGEPQNIDKAFEYWNYCCERGHRGSYYWMGILLLDTKFDYYNEEKALYYLTKASELGSERAKQKLIEFQKRSCEGENLNIVQVQGCRDNR